MVMAVAREETFREWFKARFRETKLSPTAFAEAADLNHLTVLAWLDAETPPRPQRKSLRKLADYFGADEDELLELARRQRQADSNVIDTEQPIRFPNEVELRTIPLADVTVHAGQVHWLSTESIPIDARLKGNLIGVRVVGDCLSPAIESGDIVVVDRSDLDLREGRIVVVAHDDGVVLRRVQIDNLGEFVLVSNHDMERPSNAVLLGRVVQAIRSFK
jgi:phage repressor protein C with HTH and peptisase S24 domain